MTACPFCGAPLPGRLRRPCSDRCRDLALGKRLARALRRACHHDRTPPSRRVVVKEAA